jgi:hypothetical protein
MTRLGGEAIPDDRGSVVIELFSVVRKMRKQNLSWVQVAEHMETMRRMVTSVGKKWEQEATVCIAVSRMVALSAITSRVCVRIDGGLAATARESSEYSKGASTWLKLHLKSRNLS